MDWTVENVFKMVTDNGASDLVLTVGAAPVIWINGEMQDVPTEPLTVERIEGVFLPHLSEDQRGVLDRSGDLDVSLGMTDVGRFRINIYRQRGTLSAAVRFVPYTVPTFESLNLPERVLDFAKLPRGTIEKLLEPENRHQLADILKYHVVPGRVYARDALAAQSAEGSRVRFTLRGGMLRVNDATILQNDIETSNGVIHVIDQVIMPG